MVSYGSVRAVQREGLTLNRVKRRALLAASIACIASVCLLGMVWVSYDAANSVSLLEIVPHRSGLAPAWMASVLSEPMLYGYNQASMVKPALQQLAVMQDIPTSFESEDPQILKTEADEVEAEREDLQRRDEAIAAKRERLNRAFHAMRQERRDGRSAARPPHPTQQKAQQTTSQQQPQQASAVAQPAQPQQQAVQTQPQPQQQQQQQPQASSTVFGRTEGPMRWRPEMGTDISFIRTDDFPKVMEGSWHTGAETAAQAAAANQREAEVADARLRSTVQQQAAQLAQQQAELRRLEADEEANHEEEEARFYSQPPPAPAPASIKDGGRRSGLRAATTQLQATSGSAWHWKDGALSDFSKKLQGFLGNPGITGGSSVGGLGGLERVVNGQQKMMQPSGHLPPAEEEKEEEEAEEAGELAGEEAAEEEEEEWEHPEQKGSPCNWPGQCNRGKFAEHQPGRWAEVKNRRFMTPEEIEEMQKEEAQEDQVEQEEHQDAKDARLKSRWEDRVFGGSMDDFVPGKDAYQHNLLTSSTYGVDHFGKFAPFSKENKEVMYGRFYKIATNALGEPSQTEKGDLPGVKLGENGGKIGGDDAEVALKDSMPAFPTDRPHDHFADWEHDSAKNQRMLHGRYWKELRRDGFFDRLMPAAEAYKHLGGRGNDRTISDHVLDWSMYNQGQRARENAFTGTDESIEERKGTVASGTPYLKVANGNTNTLRQMQPAPRWVQARFSGEARFV